MYSDIYRIELDEDFIENLEESIDGEMLLNLACNYNNINKIINFFKEVGITNIEDLLLNKPDIFLRDSELIKNNINKYDKAILIPLINGDYNTIDKIF